MYILDSSLYSYYMYLLNVVSGNNDCGIYVILNRKNVLLKLIYSKKIKASYFDSICI